MQDLFKEDRTSSSTARRQKEHYMGQILLFFILSSFCKQLNVDFKKNKVY